MARLLTLLPLLAVAGCTGGYEAQERGTGESAAAGNAEREAGAGASAQRAGSPVRVARLPDSGTGDAGTNSGRLEPDGPCLYLRTETGRFLLASTIPGAAWDAAGAALVLPDGPGSTARRLPAETTVTAAGSQGSAAALADHWVDPPAPECDTGRIWVTHRIVAGLPMD